MKLLNKIKEGLFLLVSLPFVFVAYAVIHMTRADHDTWPGKEEMKAGGKL